MSGVRRPLIVVLTLLFFSVTTSAQNTGQNRARGADSRTQRAPALQPTYADIAYNPHERNKIDFYLAQSEQATPLVLYIHGGGFRGGTKKGINQTTLRQLLDAGISVTAVEYRLVPGYPLPTAHRDSLRALQFIRAQAHLWNIDRQRIGAFGTQLKQMMDELGIESHLKYPGQQTQYVSMADFFIAKLKQTALSPLVRTVDLDQGQSQQVTLADGSQVRIKLLDLQEARDALCHAVREAQVTVRVNDKTVTLSSAMYHLPTRIAGVQIDCPVTRGFVSNSSKKNPWGLERDARLRLWPGKSPWLRPGTLVYPVRQRWFASDTQMANEPVFVDGGDIPGSRAIYYHYGLDFGGTEGLVEVVAATDGRVVSAAGETLTGYSDSPAQARYDVIYVVDKRGWYYRYSHLKRIDVKVGQTVGMGQHLGLLGKEGGSGGWSHLHFDITSKQPSGQWGIQDGYAYVWEAYQREYKPAVIAVARPHHLAAIGQTITLDGRKSWSRSGVIKTYEWRLSDGTTKTGPRVQTRYATPGTYSEVLKVTDGAGRQAWDFAVVQVVDPKHPEALPPSIHANYYPTRDLRPGDPVTFKVRCFRNTHGREVWDFGDGSPRVTVESDGNREVHNPNGYAVTQHRYERAGHYLVRVERANQRGERATAHLLVQVSDNIAGIHRD